MKSYDKADGCYWYHTKVFLETEFEDEKYSGIAVADSPAHYLLVNEVFKSIIENYKGDLYLWRFHRMFASIDQGLRAVPATNPVHQLKFKFYCNPEAFVMIRKQLKDDLKVFEKAKLITKFEIEKSEDSGERIGSDRDINWEPDVKLIWPYFAHGYSLAWYILVLNCINTIVDKTFKDSDWMEQKIEKRLEVYSSVAFFIRSLWVKEANGAFLHQLNGLFGYNKIWSMILP